MKKYNGRRSPISHYWWDTLRTVRLYPFFLCFLFVVITSCSSTPEQVQLRDFPAPYSAMLALCSDIDGTTPEEFEAYHEFLNTTENTPMGKGLGLDVSDSFWAFQGSDLYATADNSGRTSEAVMTAFYGMTEDYKNAGLIAYYYQNGWIDSIHSYGDFSRADTNEPSFTRELAEQAADTMKTLGISPSVWINHGNAANTQNFKESGNDYRQGADSSSPYYHADFTVPGGIKFVWLSKPDTRFGQKTPLYPVTLQDGQKLWGFHRYTGERKGLSGHNYNWAVYTLNEQLSEKHLEALVKKRQFSVTAQHLGGADMQHPLTQSAVDSLNLLKSYQEHGKILVARTSRLLEYARVREYTEFVSDGTGIDIIAVNDPQLGCDDAPSLDSLRGLTFFTDDPQSAVLSICGEPVPEELILRTEKTETEGASVGIMWHTPDTSNYTYGGVYFPH